MLGPVQKWRTWYVIMNNIYLIDGAVGIKVTGYGIPFSVLRTREILK